MSNQEFENYLRLIGKLLQLNRDQQEQISGELRDHLQSRVADLVDEGVAYDDAIGLALDEFGDAAAMAKNFQMVAKIRRRRWMMRFATLSMAGAFLVAVFSMAMWPSNARFGTPESALAQQDPEVVDVAQSSTTLSSATQRDLETERKLHEEISLDYADVPWSEVEKELEERFRINFVLDQSARDGSLTSDEPITFSLHNVPAEKALAMMLIEKNATFYIDEGVIVIISKEDEDASRFMRVKMYNCRQLIEKLNGNYATRTSVGRTNPTENGMLEKLVTGGGGSGLDGGGGMGGLGAAPKNQATQTTQIASNEDLLLDLVYSMVDPEDWESEQGSASAKIVNGVLIVKHRQSAFGKIETLLKDLVYQVNTNVEFNDAIGAVSAVDPRNSASSQQQNDPAAANADPFKSDGGENPMGAKIRFEVDR